MAVHYVTAEPRKLHSNLVYSFIVSYSSICWCLQVDIFYNFLHILGVLSLYLLRKMWHGKSVMKFSSELLQICYMDSLYHTHQYVHDFQLIYFMIFCIFGCFSVFLLRKMWPEKKMLRFLIKSCLLWSSHQNLFKFDAWINYNHADQYVGNYMLIYIIIFCIFVFFQYFNLEKFGLGI